MSDIKFRSVIPSDCDLLFRWANDPITRQNSFNTGEIDYESHVSWFHKNLSKNWFIFYNSENLPIGIVRLDYKNDEWIIGITVDPDQRGKGYASQMIKLAADKFIESNTNAKIIAYIKEENVASKKAFSNAGFIYESMVNINNHQSFRMYYSK